jgi:hypothetical protein
VVRYLQLAHNERHPQTGNSVAKVIHNFGRAEQVDRDALARLVASISRYLTPEQAATAAGGGEVEVLDSRRLGGPWILDRLWERLGVGGAIRQVAAGRRLDGEIVERVVFALVAQRALEPGSKLAATRWVGERVAIDGLAMLSDDQAYRAMDFLLEALDEIAAGIFSSVAHLLNLDLDIVFVDTTSTYWEVETADTDPELAEPIIDDESSSPTEEGQRRFGHSKDHRDDLPQVVIAMAVTRDGIPVRCWTFPGNTADTAIIRRVKDDLGGWGLRRLVWVADRGFASAANRAYLTRGAGTTSMLRSCATPTARPPPRSPGPAATAASRTTCGSRRSTLPPAVTGTATTGRGPSGSSCATTPRPPNATPRCARTWSRTCKNSLTAPTPGARGAVTSSSASCAPSPGYAATYAAPPADCYVSTTPPSSANSTWTASGCCAPLTPR